MGPAYFGIDTRRWAWDLLTLPSPKLGVGWGSGLRMDHVARFLDIWLITLWIRLELRGA